MLTDLRSSDNLRIMAPVRYKQEIFLPPPRSQNAPCVRKSRRFESRQTGVRRDKTLMIALRAHPWS
jgi:hypothetical protein